MPSPEHFRAVVTDSTTSLDPHKAADFRKEAGLPVIPLPSWITIEGESTRDFMLKTADFYERLEKSRQLFDTSGANIGQFERGYEVLIDHYGVKEIFTILSDVRLTCGVNSATAASEAIKNEHPEVKIHVLDTQLVSVGAGILIPEAIKLMSQGLSFEEIARELEQKAKNVELLIAIADAGYFLKSAGRRISEEGLKGVKTVAAAVAIAFNVYPIVALKDTNLLPITQSRGKKHIPEKMSELIERRTQKGETLKRALVTHTNCEERAKELTGLLTTKFNLDPKAIDYWEAGKVLAVYTGKNCLGVACLFE